MSTFHSDTDPATPSAIFVSPEDLVASPIAAAVKTEDSAPAIYETEFNQELSKSNGLLAEHDSSDTTTAVSATATTAAEDAEAAAAAAAIADVFAADTVAQAAEAPGQRWGPSRPIGPMKEEPEDYAPTRSPSPSPTSSSIPATESQPGPVTSCTSISYAPCALPGCTRPGFAHLKGLCPCHYPRKSCGKKWIQVSGGKRGNRQSKDLRPRCTVPDCHRLVSRGTRCRTHHWQSLNRHPDDAMMPKLCTAEGCNRLGAPLTEGMCWPHYSAHREHEQQQQEQQQQQQQQQQPTGYSEDVSDVADQAVEVGEVSHVQQQGNADSGGCATTAR